MRPTTPGFSRATARRVVRAACAATRSPPVTTKLRRPASVGLMHPALDAVLVLDQPPDLEFALDLHRQVAAFVDPFDRVARARARRAG